MCGRFITCLWLWIYAWRRCSTRWRALTWACDPRVLQESDRLKDVSGRWPRRQDVMPSIVNLGTLGRSVTKNAMVDPIVCPRKVVLPGVIPRQVENWERRAGHRAWGRGNLESQP